MPEKKGCILFDWGNTLMREFPEYEGPMADWPRVEAMPGVAPALERLSVRWSLAVATNAEASDETAIRRALSRVDLDRWFDYVFCYRTIGHKKPAPEFFQAVMRSTGLGAGELVMVGDSFANDVTGANRCGIYGVWYNPLTPESRRGELHDTIHDMSELPLLLINFA